MLHAEVQLQLNNEVKCGTITRCLIGSEGNVCGRYDKNLMLNSMMYEVEFLDGLVREYAANVIAENMITQVDQDGF